MVVHLPAIESMMKNNVESHLEVLQKLKPICDTTALRTVAEVKQWMDDKYWYTELSQINLQCAVQTVLEKIRSNSDDDQYPQMLIEAISDYLPPTTVINYDASTNRWSSLEGAAVICGYTADPYNAPGNTISPFCLMKLERGETQLDESLLHEIVVGMVLNQMRNEYPCFMYVYGGFYCSLPTDPEMEATDFQNLCASPNVDEMHACLLAEAIKTTSGKRNLPQFLGNASISTDEKMKVFIMLMFALAEANRRFGYIHGDLHGENVLIRTLASPTTFVVTVDNKKVEIELQHIPIIIDYGRSYITYKKYKLRPILYNANNDSAKVFGDLDYFCDGERKPNGENCMVENLIAKGRPVDGYDIYRLSKYLYDIGVINTLGVDINNEVLNCLQASQIELGPAPFWGNSPKGNYKNAILFQINKFFSSSAPGCNQGLIGNFLRNPNINRLFKILP